MREGRGGGMKEGGIEEEGGRKDGMQGGRHVDRQVEGRSPSFASWPRLEIDHPSATATNQGDCHSVGIKESSFICRGS